MTDQEQNMVNIARMAMVRLITAIIDLDDEMLLNIIKKSIIKKSIERSDEE
jgi:hypothetical protein